ncbi:beta-N-acetylhexosaminidase [Vandammella animalimorsus]|uniref:Beta-hexosaminidase n=1 Tax=Vandammella animalimorsus TaxID=2029117 RepID=A0A2A2T8Y5_9BURK|nr:beta-N-acetylhexosaminidase [Vandammella animalimorsus]PAT31572.1 beta-N-acetylhexosaminidase [Vandammella animalimorsus]PAX18592.1 beta-N-acetylhexosaminidase [Vandammella animalimorsus]PAX20755.1 beta-N-acetylhexosaminidase [Vandammella animalimorsus]
MYAHAPLFIDVAGTSLQAIDRERLAHPLVGGLTLFARNWEDRRQLVQLCAQIKAVRSDLLICVDQEGGRVQRFRSDGFTPLPPMRTLGAMWEQDDRRGPHRGLPGTGALRALGAATALGQVLASELRACGVDLSFTPVVDLDWGGSTVIGDRALHADARVVSLLAKALMQGLLQGGMAHCAKHFPGHGFVHADSHTEIPVDRRSLRAILQDDAAPYGWLRSSLAAVMVAHVVYARVDARPAGYSARWLRDILRGQLQFDGAIFSDDLSMEGGRRLDGRAVDATEAGVAALNAGCDLLLLCNQSLGGGAALDAWIDGMATALKAGDWQCDPHSERRRQALLPTTPPQPWDMLMQDPAYLQALEQLP